MRPLRNPRAVRLGVHVYGVAMGVAALGLALFGSVGPTDALQHFQPIAAASVVTLATLVAIAGAWSSAAVYACIFWCFHFGLITTLSTGYITTQELTNADENWVLGPVSGEAALLTLAGLLAFAAGAALVYAYRRPLNPVKEPAPRAGEGGHPYGVTGSILVLGSVAAWCAVVLMTGGVNGFSASYEDYRLMTSDYGTVLGIMGPALGCGVVLSFTGQSGWPRNAALVLYAVFAAVALPIGLRTEVMFPAVAALIASARCGRSFSSLKAAAIGVVLLLLIPIVRDVRETGVSAIAETALSAPRLDALVEMGESLHPVEQVVRWHAEGEPYEHGGSYWAPFERAAARILPDFDVIAADNDLRLMNVLVLDRIGAIGFSPVAEAYRNFGPVGVVAVLALLGMCFGSIDTIRNRRVAVLAIAVLYPPLLVNVRNSFVSVPAQCVAGVLLVATVTIVRHVVGSVLSRTAYARTAHF